MREELWRIRELATIGQTMANVAHQLGYFETIASVELFQALPQQIAALTVEAVNQVAAEMFRPSNRTVGWFDPIPVEPAHPTEAA